MERESVAIIDLGTNTFHLLIVEIKTTGDYVIKQKYKEMVKLGEGGIDKDKIAPSAFERGIKALDNFQSYINQAGVVKVLAFATSAIRTASNGPDFVKQVKDRTGIDIRVINGNEEAALIYEGVKTGLQLPAEYPVLIIDIGGGSVEFIVANSQHALLLRSLKLGAARMLETFKPSDPISTQQLQTMEKYFMKELKTLMEEIREFNVRYIVGSSGSFETVGEIIAFQNNNLLSTENINGFRFNVEQFREVYPLLVHSTKAERLALPGLSKDRSDLIVASAILMNVIFKELKISDVKISAHALKDGIFNTYLGDKIHSLGPHNAKEKNIREESVNNLFKKFECIQHHTDLVTKIVLTLFDQTKEIHWYGETERELLLYAAKLHDVGYFINRSGHHKHGQYIIMNSQLQGFSADELTLLGNIVRYHRKSLPSKEHVYFNILTPEHKIMVKRLSGILRLADHLDKGHRNLIQDIKVQTKPQSIDVHLIVTEDIGLELQYVLKERELFEEAFKTKINFFQVIKK